MLNDISLTDIPKILHKLPPREQQLLLAELDKLAEMKRRKVSQERFLKFVGEVWPTFIGGRHHAKMADAFERVARGECKRLIINMPPRHTKSEFASYLLPAWFLGKFPHKKVIQCSHTAELAVGFGRKVRNLVDTDAYKTIFPDLVLASDSKAAGRWNTNKQGDYFAIGIGGAVTGKGADVLIIDDPHSEQEAALAEINPDIYDKTYEWYTSGPRQRLQPGGSIVVVMTRWSKRDLTGQILKDAAANDSLSEWEVIEFPAILPSNNPLWPEFWELDELLKVKRDVPNSKWQAQYQQNPISESAAIIKREWWQTWDSDEPPRCDFILQSWDTAFEKTQRADYTACTTWGVFYHPDNNGITQANIILLNAFRDRMEFPALKQCAIDEYKEWQPDGGDYREKGVRCAAHLRASGYGHPGAGVHPNAWQRQDQPVERRR